MRWFALLALQIAACAALGHRDEYFFDTKPNHWVFQAIHRLRSEGILVGFGKSGYISTPIYTRSDMADAPERAYAKLVQLSDGLANDVKSVNLRIARLYALPEPTGEELAKLTSDLRDLLDERPALTTLRGSIADVSRLVKFFKQEVTAHGKDATKMEENLREFDRRIQAISKSTPADASSD